MLPDWVSHYTGKPFAHRGRGPVAYDCYGLLKAVLEREFGAGPLPDYLDDYRHADGIGAARAVVGAMRGGPWQRVTGPAQPGDALVWRFNGVARHVAVCVAPGWMLHVEKGCETVAERIDNPMWTGRLEGVFRYVD